MDISAVLSALAALAQESRLGVFRALVQAGPAGLPAGRIAERLALPAPTLSFHLAQLKAAKLASCRREGRSLIYAADYATMNAVVAFLLENCCAGDSSCAAPRCAPVARKVRATAASPRSQGGRHETSARARRRR